MVRSAAIYARISADVEGKSLAVQRQLEDCRKLAADRGWPVRAEYVNNDVSAFSGKPHRQYARMLADLESDARDAVIVDKPGSVASPAGGVGGDMDDEREVSRAEGLDPEEPAVRAALDLVRWELELLAN